MGSMGSMGSMMAESRGIHGSGGGGTVGDPPLLPAGHQLSHAKGNSIDYSLLDTEQKREGKAINLSLHYLEQVIIRLQERSKSMASHSNSSNRINHR